MLEHSMRVSYANANTCFDYSRDKLFLICCGYTFSNCPVVERSWQAGVLPDQTEAKMPALLTHFQAEEIHCPYIYFTCPLQFPT